MVAAPEAAEGFVTVEVGVSRGAAVATVGAAVGVLVGQNVGVAVGPAVAPPPMLLKLATKPLLSTELSALKVTSIVPVEDVTAAGIDVPEKLPSSGAAAVLPPYTLTKS